MADFQASRNENAAEFRTRCRELGIPLTVQRRIIFEALLERKDHPTVDEIFEGIQKKVQGVSRATVYRVLETFVQSGIVRQIYSDGSAVRFDPNGSHHHHLVCSHCNSVSDFEDERLNRLPLPNRDHTGFQTENYSVYFEGLCRRCQKIGAKSSKRGKQQITRNGKER
jgi:Fur family peroxide stress response transcriptional regulator